MIEVTGVVIKLTVFIVNWRVEFKNVTRSVLRGVRAIVGIVYINYS